MLLDMNLLYIHSVYKVLKEALNLTVLCLFLCYSTAYLPLLYNYHKVVSSRQFWLVGHTKIFRRLMKGKYDAYVL